MHCCALCRHLKGPYLSVHFRAGRILNRGTIDGGEGSDAQNRFRRVAYRGAELRYALVSKETYHIAKETCCPAQEICSHWHP